ncbi:hypothetical protein [Arthrobacter sp. 24S4-2]|uniref:hypothetical protein n=1 Tax=Arthrobacter sp. 24S4-2 TaxID=2575374 RepID=UPI0015866396|nr:hypothetical protein [Arthrobacter sp. 24S4-2]
MGSCLSVSSPIVSGPIVSGPIVSGPIVSGPIVSGPIASRRVVSTRGVRGLRVARRVVANSAAWEEHVGSFGFPVRPRAPTVRWVPVPASGSA